LGGIIVNLNKILIYGSSHFSQIVCEHLLKDGRFTLVGYVPSHNPTIRGKMPISKVEEGVEHDIKLSLQYNRKIVDVSSAYNVHTGLLPAYGGRDIFAHTLINQDTKQGLTFHKMTEKYDYGPIISTVSYPVFQGDTVLNLYQRQLQVAPQFVSSALALLEKLSPEEVESCQQLIPTMYKRAHKMPPCLAAYKEIMENEIN